MGLLIKDLKYAIRKNTNAFVLVIVGLLFISLLSLLLTESLQKAFIDSNAEYGKAAHLSFKYDEVQKADQIMTIINKYQSDIYSLFLVTETAFENNPYYYEVITEYDYATAPHELNLLPPESPGIVGYLASKLYIEKPLMLEGETLDTENDSNDSMITESLEIFRNKENEISAEGFNFHVTGVMNRDTTYAVNFCERNVVIPAKAFSRLDLPVKIVVLRFFNRPTEQFLSDLSSELNAIGSNVNTIDQVSVYEWTVLFSYLVSVIKYIIIIFLLFASLILTFNCWISSQQSLYSVYYVCGMTDRKAVFLRTLQLLIIITPVYIVSALIYKILTLLEYKKYIYSIDPIFIIVNYVVIIFVAGIISIVQNSKISAYNSLKNI